MNARLKASLVFVALLTAVCTPPAEPPEIPRKISPIAAADVPAQEPVPSCVHHWPEARYRSYQYDHIVHLISRCHRTASCSVSSNVNPTAVVVAIAPAEHLEVVTARGSETPEFTPYVRCSRGTR
jgi:hypothetical protein